jgi:hypothetical protein
MGMLRRAVNRFAPRLEHAEEHLARNIVEGRDNLGVGHFFRERFGTRGRVAQDEFGVRGIQRQRTTDDHLARQIAGLIQHVVDSGPMDCQQKSIRTLHGLLWSAGSRVTAGVPREPV